MFVFLSKNGGPEPSVSKKNICVEVRMHCGHCKAACERAVEKQEGVAACEANPAEGTLAVTGTATEASVRAAVEQAGFAFKGVKE